MKRPINPCIKCEEKCTGKCDERIRYEKEEKAYRKFKEFITDPDPFF